MLGHEGFLVSAEASLDSGAMSLGGIIAEQNDDTLAKREQGIISRDEISDAYVAFDRDVVASDAQPGTQVASSAGESPRSILLLKKWKGVR